MGPMGRATVQSSLRTNVSGRYTIDEWETLPFYLRAQRAVRQSVQGIDNHYLGWWLQ